jgi:aspartate kinase
MSEFLVNKIGGTSAGSPESIAALARSPEGTLIPDEHEGDAALALVVSAIGGVEGDERRVTSMARDYSRSVTEGEPDMEQRDAIIDRHESVYGNLGAKELEPIINDLAHDLFPDDNKTEADYVSLGEEYSARLLAAAVGGQYVEPKHVAFKGTGYDLGATIRNLRAARAAGDFGSGRPLIYAGYFGFDQVGQRQLLDRGGSDRTAAALAIALESDFYGKWSDIEGIHTANPRDIDDTLIRPRLTFAEIREYALGGNPVLNGRTPVDLDQYGWDGTLVLRSTFNPDEPGTRITSRRELDRSEPVSAIATRDVDMISVNDFGMAHAVGYVSRATRHAEDLGLSISHFPAGNDALTFVIDPDKGDAYPAGNGGKQTDSLSYEQKLEALERHLEEEAVSPNATVTVEQDRALLVLVGEALRMKDVRTLTNARFNLALLRGGVAVRDALGNIQSPSLIFEVDRGETERCQALAHAEFVSDPVLGGLVKVPSRVLRRYKSDIL